ncbi:MAG: hypothetical protein OCD02_03235 [Spirochaetaceae bacterium]
MKSIKVEENYELRPDEEGLLLLKPLNGAEFTKQNGNSINGISCVFCGIKQCNLEKDDKKHYAKYSGYNNIDTKSKRMCPIQIEPFLITTYQLEDILQIEEKNYSVKKINSELSKYSFRDNMPIVEYHIAKV